MLLAEVIVVTLLGGVIGGLASHLTNSSADDKSNWRTSVFVGVVAALAIPLFLSLSKSDLITEIFSGGSAALGDLFILLGFCLVAGFSSRSFMQNISSQIINLKKELEETKADVKVLDVKAEEADTNADKALEAAVNANESYQDTVKAESQSSITVPSTFPDVDQRELGVLKALWSKPRTRRTPGEHCKRIRAT
jgi:outer membrane murein-binding lipoprotein Lpp